MADDQVQIRIKGRHIIQEGRVRNGQVIWAARSNAVLYINAGIAEPAGVGPSNAKPAGPQETKPLGPQETKSLSGAPDGRLTDSPKSGEPGAMQSSAALPAGPLSQESNAPTLRRGRGRPRKVE